MCCQARTRAACTETASWGDHEGVWPLVSPAWEASVDLRSTRGSCTGVSQESAWHSGTKVQTPPCALHMAHLGLGTGGLCWHSSPSLAPSFPHLLAVNQAKPWRIVLRGRFSPCPAIPRWAQAGCPWGGSSFPCHSTAHDCFSMLQYSDWATGNYTAFISICSVMVLHSAVYKGACLPSTVTSILYRLADPAAESSTKDWAHVLVLPPHPISATPVFKKSFLSVLLHC